MPRQEGHFTGSASQALAGLLQLQQLLLLLLRIACSFGSIWSWVSCAAEQCSPAQRTKLLTGLQLAAAAVAAGGCWCCTQCSLCDASGVHLLGPHTDILHVRGQAACGGMFPDSAAPAQTALAAAACSSCPLLYTMGSHEHWRLLFVLFSCCMAIQFMRTCRRVFCLLCMTNTLEAHTYTLLAYV
jgi:hypothetical protein